MPKDPKKVRQGKAARDRGARGERQWRDVLRAWGFMARRGCQHKGTPDSPDVESDLDAICHWEVKLRETLSLYPAMEQCVIDAGKDGVIPVMAHRRNHKPWLVIMRADDLPEFCRQFTDAYEEAQVRAAVDREVSSPKLVQRLLTGRPSKRRFTLPTRSTPRT